MKFSTRLCVGLPGFVLVLTLLVFAFQNCGPAFEAISSLEQGSVGSDSIFTIEDLKPNIVSNCLQNSDYNACIFWKNPVAQNRAALAQSVRSDSDLSALQVHAVNISGFDNSGFLGNDFIKVRAILPGGQSVSVGTRTGRFKFDYRAPSHELGQVMAFYWLNLQKNIMEKYTGGFYAGGKSLDVITYDPDTVNNAYWNPVSQQIVMGTTPEGNEFALSAEVYAHEMGHANISFGTDFKIHEELGAAKNVVCGGGQGVCCTTPDGCSWAINEGQADYHAGILFPSNTAFLETFSNSVAGISECGEPRSMDLTLNLTAQAAFNACAGDEGEVHVTGRIYAGIWWRVRSNAEQRFPGVGASDVDNLFTAHLPALNGDDDFKTAREKIVSTDRALFNGKYGQLFTDEFDRRGISQ